PSGDQLRRRGGGADGGGHRGRAGRPGSVGRLMRVASVAGLLVGALAGCNAAPVQPIVAGTWGGDNAGLIATDSSAHVHIGCTLGDTRQAIVAGPDGGFDVAGRYDITVHPVSRGPDHPARFAGTVTGIV